ncbi:tetratricopeptide repeat protein [Niabella insulamsoli]|uniref:tetratricopeptide repeat protein n=1 Tax=Niabella insulamsoli TaxID=3144874 RepID=UPI0031FC0A46
MTDRKLLLRVTLGWFLLLILAYLNHFQNGFHFDDSHTITYNTAIRNIKNVPAFFSDPTMFSANPQHHHLRPWVTTTLAVDYWLGGGLYPFFFHLSTFLVHIGLCLLLFSVYKEITGNALQHRWAPWIALFAAGVFGMHTAVAETINYVISRSDVWSTFFIVLSLFLFIRFPAKRKYGLYILAAVAGVFAKETVPVLLVLLFFYILFFEKNLSVAQLFTARHFKTVLGVVGRLLPLLLAVAIVQIYTLTRVNTETQDAGLSNPLISYWLTQTYVWFRYFITFFWPFHLSADTDLKVISDVSNWRIIVGVLFVMALLVSIVKTSARKETRPISFGLIWFAASLLPTSLLPFSEVMNDHRMYFAFTGLALAIVYAAGLLVIRRESSVVAHPSYKKAIIFAMALIIGLHAFGVHQRNKVWFTEETLWKDVTEKSPENGRGWMNYGLSLMSRGDYVSALKMFEKANTLLTDYSFLNINMAIANAGLKRNEEAVANFARAIMLAPNDYNSYAYYARYLVEQQKFAPAKEMAEKALSLNKNDIISLESAMAAYQGLQQWDKLKQTASYTLSIDPENTKAANYLAAAHQQKATVALPSSGLKTSEDYINLSLVLYNAGAYEDCIAACRNALALKPDNADAYNNICAAYNMLKQWDKAKEACKKALELNPNHANAPANLKWAENERL